MKKLITLALAATLLACGASAAQEEPESCKPKIGGSALALADEIEDAQLQCDLDKAAQIADESERLFNIYFRPAIRIVDTATPSGAAYVYDIVDSNDQLTLDVRRVPITPDARVGSCRLRTTLDDTVGQNIAAYTGKIMAARPAAYGKREEVIINADGSRQVKLLLDAQDIVTTIETDSGEFAYSRHTRSTGPVNDLNELIIGVANASNGWQCNPV